MSVEDVDADLRRGVLHRPTPVVIELVDHDPAWSDAFARHRDALAGRPGVRGVEHIGATAIEGLAAVAVIDLLLVDDDPDAQGARRFRDRLRMSGDDRRRYESVTRGLAGPWPDSVRYAEAKTGVIRSILAGRGLPASREGGTVGGRV